MINGTVILGIDPGTVVMGYGLIRIHAGRYELISAGAIRLNTDDEHYLRLNHIFNEVRELITLHNASVLAIEEPFFGKNVQSMLKLGRAQGVAMAAAMQQSIPVFGYTPRKVKQSITGRGAASKEQVSSMIRQLLQFEEKPSFFDATDALAVALCHHFQNRVPVLNETSSPGKKVLKKARGYSGWETFLKDNPERKV